MKALILILSLAVVGGGAVHWKQIFDVKESLEDYNKSSEKLIQSTQQIMINSRLKALKFIEEISNSYLSTTSQLNETKCYKSFFNLTRMQRSFQSEIKRAQVPLKNLLVELKGKFDTIYDTINMCQDLADGRYSICKVTNANASCEEDVNRWLKGILNTVRCQLTPTCNSHVLSKRSIANFCPQGTFVCNSGQCISPQSVCDGNYDCSDQSDESRCCRNYQYHCWRTSGCISTSRICDGYKDCDDETDELQCGKNENECTIEKGMHKCDSDKCIGLEQVCDGTNDCNDGSDEGDQCGIGICPEECAKKGGICFHGPVGPLCLSQCPLGTFESPEGCIAHLHPTNRTVAELMEEIPKLAYRQNGKITYLKIKAVETVSNLMIKVFKCLDPNYPELAKVLYFPNYNQSKPIEPFETTESIIDV